MLSLNYNWFHVFHHSSYHRSCRINWYSITDPIKYRDVGLLFWPCIIICWLHIQVLGQYQESCYSHANCWGFYQLKPKNFVTSLLSPPFLRCYTLYVGWRILLILCTLLARLFIILRLYRLIRLLGICSNLFQLFLLLHQCFSHRKRYCNMVFSENERIWNYLFTL
jgi:hypothetical protein